MFLGMMSFSTSIPGCRSCGSIRQILTRKRDRCEKVTIGGKEFGEDLSSASSGEGLVSETGAVGKGS